MEYSPSEEQLISDLFLQTTSTGCPDEIVKNLRQVVLEALPGLSPALIVKLRKSSNHTSPSIRKVAAQLNTILNDRLESAKMTLLELLNAGEVRKLDALIGEAARLGKLDAAFFNVLSSNLKDALYQERSDASLDMVGDRTGPSVATRGQVLQHIYTRCQEEVEKALPPGTALLNKLLRTKQESIRKNLYQHYLTPQPREIKSPDGRIISLKTADAPNDPAMIPIAGFVEAISQAVLQVRTVEKAGGIDRENAAAMVESCRQVAREARLVIAEAYGAESEEIYSLQEGLQPVFRPATPASPFIQGLN